MLKVASWHNVRAQPEAFEGTKAAALPTLGIKGRFKVYGAGLEPMSAFANSTFAEQVQRTAALRP
jgi:hypothetical protein